MKPISALLRGLRSFWHDQTAATAVTVTLLTPVLVGSMGFVIDIGHVAVVQRQLQAATDAAALAGGYGIPTNTAVSTANSYSAKNPLSGGLTASMASGYPKLKCLTTTSVNCAGTELAGGANAVQVSETASVPLWFAQIVGFSAFNVSATSTAGARGGVGEALNVMIVLDTTASMSSGIDNACGLGSSASREDCALAGIKTLLTGLNPSLDQVGLMVFPGLQASTQASNDYTCGQTLGSGSTQTYGNSPVYQVVGLSNDFKASSSATTLSPTSHLSLAVNAGGCTSGVSAPGGQGTYYAQAINAAQAALVALSSSQSPPSQNVIVFLSDGDSNATNAQTDFTGHIGNCTPGCVASTTLTVATCPNSCAASTSSSKEGPLAAGEVITGTGVTAGTTIVRQLTGVTGGAGTYQLSKSMKVGTTSTAVSMVGATQITSNGYTFSQNANQCQQAIAAAQAAAKTGTWVYSIAYGATTGSSCGTDTSSVISGMSGLSSCTAMYNIANSLGNYPDKSKFYSNNNNGADCPNSNTVENLVSLFTNLSTNLTEPRLIPNNTT